MPICVYCKCEKPFPCFSNREHVIPKAFGLFCPENIILNGTDEKNKKVCNACNAFFGGNHDRWLARNSYEGYIQRNRHLKPSQLDKYGKVILKSDEGEFKGHYLEICKDNCVKPVRQIGLKKKDGDFDFFLPENFESIEKEKYQTEGECLLYFEMSDEEAKGVFNKIGIRFNKVKDIPPPDNQEIHVSMEIKIDKFIKKSITKIAFNYFSYFNKVDNLISQEFDKIREFILKDEDMDLVKVSQEPVLFDESLSRKRLGHIISVDKDSDGNIVSYVSLFNVFKYTVLLAKMPINLRVKTGMGHFFSLERKTILEIKKSSLIIPRFKIIIPIRKLWIPENIDSDILN
ncbi:MAG: hypothetical protein GKR77_05375 [Legionellales bacterium]|nr:hypothetical protein [Legionellales bacterium]